MSIYPEITQREFCDHVDDDDFFLVYGNPVVLIADNGTKLFCIAFPMYERLIRISGRGDEIDTIKRECAEQYQRELSDQTMTARADGEDARQDGDS